MGNDILGQTGSCRHRPGHQSLRDTHPKSTGQEFVEKKPAPVIQFVPGFPNGLAFLRFIPIAQILQVGDPFRQGSLAFPLGRGQEKGNGFRQVAHDLIGAFKEPGRNTGQLGCPCTQLGAVHQTLGTPMGEQGNGPHPVGLRCRLQILGQGGHLDRGPGAFINRLEDSAKLLHEALSWVGSGSSSPEYSVRTTRA